MKSPELLRLREVDRRLQRRAIKRRKILDKWEEIDRERRAIEQELKALREERINLAQGQMILILAG